MSVKAFAADLTLAVLVRADCEGSVWVAVDAQYMVAAGVILRNCEMTDTNAAGSDISGGDLSKARVRGGDWLAVNAEGCIFDETEFAPLKSAGPGLPVILGRHTLDAMKQIGQVAPSGEKAPRE